MTIQALTKNIKTMLADKNMSVRELERRSGIKPGTIQNILHGRSKNPTIEVVSAIAKQLDCGMQELLKDGLIDKSISLKSWSKNLALDCTIKVYEALEKSNLYPEISKVNMCVEEIFLYAKKRGDETIDEQFVEWFIDRTFK